MPEKRLPAIPKIAVANFMSTRDAKTLTNLQLGFASNKAIANQQKVLAAWNAHKLKLVGKGKDSLGSQLKSNWKKSIAKSLAKVAIKRELSQLMEGKYADAYIDAQIDQTVAFNHMRLVSRMYFELVDELKVLQETRQLLAGTFDEDAALIFKRNLDLDLHPENDGYTIWIQDARKPTQRERFRVHLGGQEALHHPGGGFHYWTGDRLGSVLIEDGKADLKIEVIK